MPDGKPIKPGGRDARVPAIAAALAGDGLSPRLQRRGNRRHRRATPDRYSPQLVAAVKQLQADFGLKPDGIIGGDTLDALNAGPAGLARASCAIAMERLRWLQRDPPQTRIDVNTAASFLDYWRDGQHVDQRKVVDGEPDKPTPQLQAPIFRLVANPTWTRARRHRREGAGEQEPGLAAAKTISSMKNGQYVQQSGPKNSLGLVKFDMEDDAGDLPARHAGQGAVRAARPPSQPRLRAGRECASSSRPRSPSRKASLDEFQKAMASQDENVRQAAETKSRSGCSITPRSGTARAIQFRPDVYGWDDNIAKALGLAPGPPQQDRAAAKAATTSDRKAD